MKCDHTFKGKKNLYNHMCSICPKSDRKIFNLLSFMIGLSLQSLRSTNRRPWPKWCSEAGLHCCLLSRLVPREEQWGEAPLLSVIEAIDPWLVQWGKAPLLLAIEASNPSVFWELHPGLVEQGVQIPLELPVVWMQVHRILLSVCLE